MSLIPRGQANELGVSPFGDNDAPLLERIVSTFVAPEYVAVRDGREAHATYLAQPVGDLTTRATMELSGPEVSIA